MKKIVAAFLTVVFSLSGFAAFAEVAHQMVHEEEAVQLNDAAANGERWIVCGDDGIVLVSENLEKWSRVDLPSGFDAEYTVWADSAFLVFGDGAVYVSQNGDFWSKVDTSGDLSALAPYMTIRADGNYAFVDEYSSRYVGTSDFHTYYKNYYIGGNFLFPSEGFGQQEYDSNEKMREDTLRVSEADGSSYPLNRTFHNIDTVSLTDGKCAVYAVYSEEIAGTDQDRTTIEVSASADFQNWADTVYRLERKRTDKHLLCANGTSAYFFYEGDGPARAAENPLLSGGKIYGSDYRELVSHDGLAFSLSDRTIPFDNFQSAFTDQNGNVVLLTYDKVYFAKAGEAYKIFEPLKADYANGENIYYSGKEWIDRYSFRTSEDGLVWESMDLSPEMQPVFESFSPRFVWDGTNYVAYSANKLQQYVQPSGTIYEVANGFGWLVGQHTTPGTVDDMSYSDGVYYISVPTAYYGEDTHTLYYSTNLDKWTKLEGFSEVPAALTDGKWAVLPVYRYQGIDVVDGAKVPVSAELYLMSKKDKEPVPVRYQSFSPRKVGTVGNYFYAVGDSWQGCTLWVSREGIYWHLLKELSDLDDIYKVYEKGENIIAQSGVSAHATMAVMDKEEFYAAAEEALSGSRSTMYIKVDGTFLGFDTEPVLENDRTLVPLRYIFETMGAEVTWNNDTRTATVAKDGISVDVTIDSNTAYVNGQAFTLDVPPRLVEDRTLIPLRFLSEQLGYEVEWDAATNVVEITEKKNSSQTGQTSNTESEQDTEENSDSD